MLKKRTTGEVGKLLGAKWKEMSDEDKKPYIDQAAKDKERADEEKAAYDVSPLLLSNSSTPHNINTQNKQKAGSGGDDEDEE